MFQLFREIFKPALHYFRNSDFREYVAVKSKCRNIPSGIPIEIKIAGFSIKSRDASSLLYQYEEIFVNRSYQVSFEKPNPIIYCCGANIGLELIFFKKQFQDCTIHAYEADPEIAEVLAENISVNQLKNVIAKGAAVWTENGTLSFHSDGALGGKLGNGKMTVPCIRLADELDKEINIDLLVLDIEGAELEVLNDCKLQLKKVERLFVEWHGNANEPQQLQELLNLLNESGFRYRLNNKLPIAPFSNVIIENGFDAMVEIYASRK